MEKIPGHDMEFLAYEVLYYVLNGMKFELSKMLKDLTPRQKKHPFVGHALKYALCFRISLE